MRHTYRFAFALLVVVTLVFLLADLSIAQDRNREWVTIESFEGQGQRNTRPFTVESSEWRVQWESVGTMQEGLGHIFQIYVQKPDDDLFMEIAANVNNVKRASDISYIYESGRFYLRVNAANADWEVKIQTPSSTSQADPTDGGARCTVKADGIVCAPVDLPSGEQGSTPIQDARVALAETGGMYGIMIEARSGSYDFSNINEVGAIVDGKNFQFPAKHSRIEKNDGSVVNQIIMILAKSHMESFVGASNIRLNIKQVVLNLPVEEINYQAKYILRK